jgi:hypothetical protein
MLNRVNPKEILARYLFSHKNYSRERNIVRPAAFLPASDSDMLSVFRTSGLSTNEIWAIGDDVGRASQRPLHGRADIAALQVQKQRLFIDLNNNPPRHANITGWPPEKPKRLSIAQELAEVAKLELKS